MLSLPMGWTHITFLYFYAFIKGAADLSNALIPDDYPVLPPHPLNTSPNGPAIVPVGV